MNVEFKDLNPTHVWTYFYDLTQIPRPTGHTAAVASYVENFGKKLGLETLRDAVGNVLIRKPATQGMEECRTVILQSHLDMVPQKNSSSSHDFLNDPIPAYIDGEWIKAKNTTLGADNGIGVAIAMAVLSDNSLQHGEIEALFTIDEEEGMTGAFGLDPDFLKGRILINCDSEEEGQLFVGCAGGLDANFTFNYTDEIPDWRRPAYYRITLVGLKGGHSGVDIHLGRANANKIMAQLLLEIMKKFDAQIASFNGGSLRNAIPREAVMEVAVSHDYTRDLINYVLDYQYRVKKEYLDIEPKFQLMIGPIPQKEKRVPLEIQRQLVDALLGCQNGVISMQNDFPGTVETSSNLASVTTFENRIEVKFLIRSSSETRKRWLFDSISSVFPKEQRKEAEGSGYSGWKPNINSPILKLMQRTYTELYGKIPEVKVMHAGLECGIIQGIYQDMDMISIGPDLQYPHSPDERVNIASVEKTWNFLKETLKQIKNIE
jgi:dipeptidase D